MSNFSLPITVPVLDYPAPGGWSAAPLGPHGSLLLYEPMKPFATIYTGVAAWSASPAPFTHGFMLCHKDRTEHAYIMIYGHIAR